MHRNVLCSITLAFLFPFAAGPVAAGSVSPEITCQAAQLKASAKLCKKLFACAAKGAKTDAFDAIACAAQAESGFVSAWDRALARAVKKGGSCAVLEDASVAAARVRGPADALVATVLVGANSQLPEDAKLRSSLLKGSGSYCGGALKALAGAAVKRKTAKLAKQSGKARGRFARASERATERAVAAGLFTTLDGLDLMVDLDGLAQSLGGAFAPLPIAEGPTVAPHAADPRMLGFDNAFGEFVEIGGEKDAAGLPTAIGWVQTVGPEGVGRIEFDAQSRPLRAVAPDGTRFELTWGADGDVFVEALTADGSVQANASASLGAPVAAAPLASARRVPRGANISAATVSVCGEPVTRASVNLLAARLDDENGSEFSVPGSHQGEGIYHFGLPSAASLKAEVQPVCEGVLGLVGVNCAFLGALGPAGVHAICPLVGRSALGTRNALAAGSIYATCLRMFETYIREGFRGCRGIDEEDICRIAIERALPEDTEPFDAAVVADIPFEGRFTSDLVSLDLNGALPDFTIDVEGETSLASFTTVPADPAPGENYTASADVSCADAGSSVTVSVVGDDGFTTSNTCTFSGSGTCDVFVPGGAAGVRDTLTVEILDGPMRTIGLIF
ncbi:MAG: hypothetical protein ACR2PQ_06420 [Myxococcota bacterium]